MLKGIEVMLSQRIRNNDNLTAFFFLTPSVGGFLTFFLLPFILGIYYSLISSPVNGQFVGLSNYSALLRNPIFLKAALNTLVFMAVCVPATMIISLAVAMLLRKDILYRNFMRTAFILPLVVPVASVVLLWQILFNNNGFTNGILNNIGCSTTDWMNTGWARVIVICVYLWKNVGYNMIVFMAGLENIPVQYYECADVEGAGSWYKFSRITLFYLSPTTFFIFIMSIINSFKIFKEIYMIAGEYPHDSIYTMQHYMNNMFLSLDYQKLTSAAFILAVLIFILVWLLFRIETRIGDAIRT